MANIYHAGRRIQGLSVNPNTSITPSVEADYTNSSWSTQVNTSGTYWQIANNSQEFQGRLANSGSGSNYDLGTSFQNINQWTLRFEITIDSNKEVQFNGDCITMFGIQSGTTMAGTSGGSGGSYSSSRAQAQFQIATANSTRKFQGQFETGTSVGQDNSHFTMAYSNDTKYYIELKKTGSTSYTLSAGTNSDYETGRTSSNITVSLSGLRYLHMETWNQNSSYESRNGGKIENLKIWTDNPKPTDVQVGSRFEETDTRKMYYYGGGGGSITKDNQDIVQRGNATPSNGSGTGLVSGTFSNFAVGNNSNRVLIIASGCYNASPNITGVTFNGSENFEKIIQYKPASNFNHEFWILYNPTVTTADVVITYGNAGGSFQDGAGQTGAICYSFYNVKQSDAFGTPVEKNSGASATPFIAITPTTAGSMIIDCYFSGAGSPVPNNDETDGMNIICGGVDRSMASQYDLNPTIGSVNNMSRTSGNSSYSQIAVEIKVAVDEWKELGT